MIIPYFLMGAILIIVSFVIERKPPKGINRVYGYRTKRSMRNEDTWKVGNEYSNQLMRYVGVISLAIGVVAYLFIPNETIGLLIALLLPCALLLAIVILTEQHLKTIFDDFGNRR